MVLLDSRASFDSTIRAWYSAALFDHGFSSEKACGIKHLLGLTKRMPNPDTSFSFSFVLVAPLKCMSQEAFDGEVSTL